MISPISDFGNARPQRAFAGDKHSEMRAGRALFHWGSGGAEGEKTRVIFRVENARAQRAFPLVSLPYFNYFVTLVCL